MNIRVRRFREADIPSLIEILKMNDQYDYPAVEGPDSMRRVAKCDAALFLVAEVEENPCGFVKGVYDGSRALIHLLAIHPQYQRRGVGTTLVDAVATEFLRREAPTVSVLVTQKSMEFWEKQGFRIIPISLMLKELE